VGVGNVPGGPGATGGYITYGGETAQTYQAGAAGGGGGGGSQGGDESIESGRGGGSGGISRDQQGGKGGEGATRPGDYRPATSGATASGKGGNGGRAFYASGGGGGGGGVAFPGGYFGGGGGGGGGSRESGGDGGPGGDGAMQIAKWQVAPAKGLYVVGNGHPVVRFAANLSQAAMFPAVMPRQYAGGTLDVTLMWSGRYYMGCTWFVATERHYDGYYLLWRQFTAPAAVYAVTNVNVPDSATYTKLVIPSPCFAGEHFRLIVQADPYGADVYLHSIELRESRF
jgi:hypothetical protein